MSPNPEIERKTQLQYYGAVSSVDREVGKVLAELEASGQMDNTLIVYTSDHGLNAGHHGTWEKGNATVPQNFLEESVRVSCTLSWPAGGIRKNAVCDDWVTHCDLWATLLDAAGASLDKQVVAQINSPGISYLPQLRGGKASNGRSTIFSEYGNARMARSGRYKLIVRSPFAGRTYPNELYDLRDDPRETVNCYNDSARQGVIDDLAAQMNQYFAKYAVAGRSGFDLEHQPQCNPHSPWLARA